MKLYRIVPYDPEAHAPTVIIGRREMLVEVVPDYEAAAAVLYAYGNFRHGKQTELEVSMFIAEVVKPVVDGALEGNNDE